MLGQNYDSTKFFTEILLPIEMKKKKKKKKERKTNKQANKKTEILMN